MAAPTPSNPTICRIRAAALPCLGSFASSSNSKLINLNVNVNLSYFNVLCLCWVDLFADLALLVKTRPNVELLETHEINEKYRLLLSRTNVNSY